MTTSIPGATVHPPVTALAMTPPSLATHLFDEAALARLRAAADVRAGVITSFTSPPPELDLSDIEVLVTGWGCPELTADVLRRMPALRAVVGAGGSAAPLAPDAVLPQGRSEEHTSELQSRFDLVCRLLLENKYEVTHIASE